MLRATIVAVFAIVATVIILVAHGTDRYLALDTSFADLTKERGPDERTCERHFICQTFKGRLGNHLFQYASTYGLSRRYNLTILLAKDDDLVKYFHVSSAKVITNRSVCQRFTKKFERRPAAFDESFLHLQNNTDYLVGVYLQSWKYFSSYYSEVRSELTFQESIENKSRAIVEGYRQGYMKKLGVSSVIVFGLHIRRGDLVESKGNGRGSEPAPDKYIYHAIDYVLRTYEQQVLFIVCSDGIEYARAITTYRNISVEYVHLSPVEDLAVIAHTDNIIMTVGTFGWWAGFLSRGTVIYYKYPVLEGSPARKVYDYDDHFLPEWIGLDRK